MSFNKLTTWSIEYFREVSSWLLRNRRDVSKSIAYLNSEIRKIGFVKFQYRMVGNKATEEKVGVFVSPKSNLERLMKAYIVQGGNPLVLNIMYPDKEELVGFDANGSPILIEPYPSGGVAYPQSVDYNNPAGGFEAYQGGWVSLSGYLPARQGGRRDPSAFEYQTILDTMIQIREWANLAIKERVQDIEWRILKQCDLKEQLLRERDETLVQAFGGSLDCLLSDFDSNTFPELRVQTLIQDMNELLYLKEGYAPSLDLGHLGFAVEGVTSELLGG